MIFSYFLYFSSGLLIFLGFLNLKYISNQIVIQLLLLILLLIIFYNVNLIMAFGIYFVFWHSIPSIQDQLMYLDGEVTLKTVLGYIKSSLVYWVLSLIGLFLFYFYMDIQSEYFIPLFFSFLAAITFPHTVVIGMLKSE